MKTADLSGDRKKLLQLLHHLLLESPPVLSVSAPYALVKIHGLLALFS